MCQRDVACHNKYIIRSLADLHELGLAQMSHLMFLPISMNFLFPVCKLDHVDGKRNEAPGSH